MISPDTMQASQKSKGPKPSFRCIVAHCRRSTHQATDMCSMHKMRVWRAKNPERAAWQHLRSSAKKRGIAFTLTFEEFVAFCKATGYVESKGGLHVDRVDCLRGYEAGNIRALPCYENLRKAYAESRIHATAGTAPLPLDEAQSTDENEPF